MDKKNLPFLLIFLKGFLILCIGFLFKIMHWLGAKILLITGSILIVLAILVHFTISILKSNRTK